MSWFGIPIELSRSELPDVVIHVRWRSSRLVSGPAVRCAFIVANGTKLGLARNVSALPPIAL